MKAWIEIGTLLIQPLHEWYDTGFIFAWDRRERDSHVCGASGQLRSFGHHLTVDHAGLCPLQRKGGGLQSQSYSKRVAQSGEAALHWRSSQMPLLLRSTQAPKSGFPPNQFVYVVGSPVTHS